MDSEYEYKKHLHEKYVEQRQETDRFNLEIGARYEKFLSFIAGGALVVSFTFINEIAEHPISAPWLVLVSWLSLVLGVVSTLFAIRFSHKALHRKIQNLDSEILKDLNPDNDDYNQLDCESNPHTAHTNIANNFSLWSTILGLVTLCIFTFLNFSKNKNALTTEDNEQFRKEEHKAREEGVVYSLRVTSSSPEAFRVELIHPSEFASSSTKAEEVKRLNYAERTTREDEVIPSEADGADGGILRADSESGEAPKSGEKPR